VQRSWCLTMRFATSICSYAAFEPAGGRDSRRSFILEAKLTPRTLRFFFAAFASDLCRRRRTGTISSIGCATCVSAAGMPGRMPSHSRGQAHAVRAVGGLTDMVSQIRALRVRRRWIPAHRTRLRHRRDQIVQRRGSTASLFERGRRRLNPPELTPFPLSWTSPPPPSKIEAAPFPVRRKPDRPG